VGIPRSGFLVENVRIGAGSIIQSLIHRKDGACPVYTDGSDAPDTDSILSATCWARGFMPRAFLRGDKKILGK
jgi:hypothetical protein